MKKRRKITTKAKRRSAPKVARGRRSTVAGNDKKFALLKRERDEALAREAAAAEVLKVISSSQGKVESVFQAMLANATKICTAEFGSLYLYDGEAFHAAAFHNAPPGLAEVRIGKPLRPPSDSALALQLLYWMSSESMGNHDSEIVDAGSVD